MAASYKPITPVYRRVFCGGDGDGDRGDLGPRAGREFSGAWARRGHGQHVFQAGRMVFAVKTSVVVAVVAVWIKRLVAQVLNRGDGGVW